MKEKSVLLLIVEGQTEETALSTGFSRIFAALNVKFKIVRGDITSVRYNGDDDVVRAVNDLIDDFCSKYIKRTDIIKVVHLVDADGAFISKSSIYKSEEHDKTWYARDGIYIANPKKIENRNKAKKENLSALSSRSKIGEIPYSVYYSSVNFDDIICQDPNLQSDAEKKRAAEDFDMKYGEDTEEFIKFFTNLDIAVQGGYGDTWWFIKNGLHSLERHTNLGLCFSDSTIVTGDE